MTLLHVFELSCVLLAALAIFVLWLFGAWWGIAVALASIVLVGVALLCGVRFQRIADEEYWRRRQRYS